MSEADEKDALTDGRMNCSRMTCGRINCGRMTYVLDGRQLTNREVAMDQLVRMLPLPAHFGRNLDALADALWELPPCELVVEHADGLGEYGQRVLRVLRDVAERDEALNLTVKI